MATLSNIIIIGAGMGGLASAIAIAQTFVGQFPENLRITCYELRSGPSTMGGPVNLTPKALCCLDIIGVLEELREMKAGCEVGSIELFSLHTGGLLSTIDYSGPEGKGFGGYKGWRVMRSELLQALLRRAEKWEAVKIVYGKKVVGLDEDSDEVRVRFEDGTTATGDIVLGCDGIHSAVRQRMVEPDRTPSYSGIASAYGFVETKDVIGPDETPFFHDTALAMSRYGSTLTTFCDHERRKIYVVVLMEAEEQGSREEWKTMSGDQDTIRQETQRRTRGAAIPGVEKMVSEVKDWTFYPVYLLPPNGRWSTRRVLLLGDAAHAVCLPPNS